MEKTPHPDMDLYQVFVRGDREYYEPLTAAAQILERPMNRPARLGGKVLESDGQLREITEQEETTINGLAADWAHGRKFPKLSSRTVDAE